MSLLLRIEHVCWFFKSIFNLSILHDIASEYKTQMMHFLYFLHYDFIEAGLEQGLKSLASQIPHMFRLSSL